MKQSEEALQKAKDELEIRVKERTAELTKTNITLQEEITERKQAEEMLEKRTPTIPARRISVMFVSPFSPESLVLAKR